MRGVLPCDRHRRLVELRLSGLTCPEIAQRLRYSDAAVVRKTLCQPRVRAYATRLREQLEAQFLDAQRFTLSQAVQAAARSERALPKPEVGRRA
jgi:hypothetical protein